MNQTYPACGWFLRGLVCSSPTPGGVFCFICLFILTSLLCLIFPEVRTEMQRGSLRAPGCLSGLRTHGLGIAAFSPAFPLLVWLSDHAFVHLCVLSLTASPLVFHCFSVPHGAVAFTVKCKIRTLCVFRASNQACQVKFRWEEVMLEMKFCERDKFTLNLFSL